VKHDRHAEKSAAVRDEGCRGESGLGLRVLGSGFERGNVLSLLVDVEILDIMGRKIQIEKVYLENSRNEFTLNLADIKSGQDLLRVTTHEGVRSLRFIRK
jgi:hypothetical protein